MSVIEEIREEINNLKKELYFYKKIVNEKLANLENNSKTN